MPVGFGRVWIDELIIVDPFIFLEQIVEHVGDIQLNLFRMGGCHCLEAFVEDNVELWAHKVSPRIINQSTVACMIARLTNIDAHIAAGAREFGYILSILQFLDENEDRAAENSKIAGMDAR
jgi:5-formaminoimidazole-4-carboxamide-1-beta-D-ribofuranosyl 5'-monophosphate synthetase